MHFKENKLLRRMVTAFFTFGAVASIGFLGFTGTLLLPMASIPLAIAVFIFSGAIEETVYSKSIYKGLGRLKLIGPKAQRHFLKMGLDDYLDDFIKENGPEKLKARNEDFLKDYYEQRDYYKNLKRNHSNIDKNELRKTKKRLNELRDYFYIQTKQNKLSVSTDNKYIDSTLQLASKDLLRGAKRKLWVSSVAFVVSLIVGLGTGLVTASAMSSALLELGVALGLVFSATTLSAIVWPIAILAMVAGVFLLYKNTTDFFKKDFAAIAGIKGAWRFIRQLPTVVWQNVCQLPTGIKGLWQSIYQSPGKATKTFFINVLKIVTGSVVVSLTLFAAIATLCTWGLAIKAGLNLIPGVPLIVIMVCCPILVGLNFLTDLTYGFSTSAETIQAFFSIKISELKSQLWGKFHNLRSTESFLQLINPFRLIVNTINGVFQLLIFSAHVLSVGITTDCLGKIPPALVAVGCALPEALQDASFFVGKSNQTEEHDHGGLIMRSLGLVKNIILIALLIPFLDALWHWAFKKQGSDVTLWKALCISLKRCCEIEEHQHDTTPADTAAPQLSEAWREKHRPEFILSEAANHLNSASINQTSIQEKKTCLEDLRSTREEIVKVVKEKTAVGETPENAVVQYLKTPQKDGATPYTILSRHRFFQVKGASTTTENFVKDAFKLVAAGG